MPVCFLKKACGFRWEGLGEELGGTGGGETVIRTYCMKKKSAFNKRKMFKKSF